MAKKKTLEDLDTNVGGISSILKLVNKIDNTAEIIAESACSNITDWVGTGNYILNACMSGDIFKAIGAGRIISFAGESGCGKSFLAVSCAREALKKGYTPIVLDSEGAYDSDFVRRLGCDPSRLIIKQVNTILETSQFIANLCKELQEQQDKTGTHDKVLFILDSLGNLTSDKEKEDTLSGSTKADFTKAKEVKALFRVNATPLARLQIPFIVNNHVYSSMSFIPTAVQSSGTGIVYNASCTILLSAAKLADTSNDKVAKDKAGDSAIKNGILVTAKPIKSRFCRPIKIQFSIPFYKPLNPYIGLEKFMTWENSGCCRGNIISLKDYDKLSEAEKNKIYTFEYNNTTIYCQPKDTARGIVVKHLGEQVSFVDFWSEKVFTPEFLEYINENVIKPVFQLPDQSSYEDILDIEETIENIGEDAPPIVDPVNNLMNE